VARDLAAGCLFAGAVSAWGIGWRVHPVAGIGVFLFFLAGTVMFLKTP